MLVFVMGCIKCQKIDRRSKILLSNLFTIIMIMVINQRPLTRQPHMDWFLWNPTMIFGELRLKCPQWNVINDHYNDGKDYDQMTKMAMTKMMMLQCQYHSRKVDSSRDRLPAILEPSWLVWNNGSKITGTALRKNCCTLLCIACHHSLLTVEGHHSSSN